MCMDEFVNKSYDLKGIDKNFWSQNSNWIVKNNCDSILTGEFNLSQHSRYISDIFNILPIYLRYISDIYR